MFTPDHKQIAESWLTVQRHWWAYYAVSKIVKTRPQEALSLVIVLLELANSPEDLRDIGCGPLEDLLRLHAASVIDTIESTAANNAQLRTALSHVWFSQGEDSLNQRVEALGCTILKPRGPGDA